MRRGCDVGTLDDRFREAAHEPVRRLALTPRPRVCVAAIAGYADAPRRRCDTAGLRLHRIDEAGALQSRTPCLLGDLAEALGRG